MTAEAARPVAPSARPRPGRVSYQASTSARQAAIRRAGRGEAPPAVPTQAPADREPLDVETLVREHLPLASYAVHEVGVRTRYPAHIQREDLIAVAQVALFDAARRYDANNAASFMTFAMPRLQGAILDELRSTDWASRGARKRGKDLEQATDGLATELGRLPTEAEIAARLDITEEALRGWRADLVRAIPTRLDEVDVEVLLPSRCDGPEEALLRNERNEFVRAAIKLLPGQLGMVLARHFYNDESLTEIARDLGLTLSRVSQMRGHGLRLIQAAITAVFDGDPIGPSAGGVRARRTQAAYLQRVATATGRSLPQVPTAQGDPAAVMAPAVADVPAADVAPQSSAVRFPAFTDRAEEAEEEVGEQQVAAVHPLFGGPRPRRVLDEQVCPVGDRQARLDQRWAFARDEIIATLAASR